MTKTQVTKIRKAIKRKTKEFKQGSKEAMNYLVAAGIYTPKGTLRKAYQ
jgi:hypothetical protein